MDIISDHFEHAERGSGLLNSMPDRGNAGDVGNDEEYEPKSEHGNHDDSEKNNSSDAHEIEQLQEASDGYSSASNQCVQPARRGMKSSDKGGSNSCARKAGRVNEILHSSGVADASDEEHSSDVQPRSRDKISQKKPRKALKRRFLSRNSRSDNGTDIQGHGKLPQRRAGIFLEFHKRHRKNSNKSNGTASRNLSKE
ncbi:hypothetical protein FGB62_31g117 [Gracilaria domingensis]|nr:hypothetical protein FGB62_31g117 [Gracilaria domingensis]